MQVRELLLCNIGGAVGWVGWTTQNFGWMATMQVTTTVIGP